MDCSICSPVLSLILRPPRNSICQACYDGAKGMIAFFNKLEHNREIIDNPSFSDLPKSNSSKFQGIGNALKWVEDMKEREEGLNEKLSFLSGLVTVFKDGIHADIQVKPGNGSSIFAHRVVLAARSGIFKNMLETDGCKAPPNETISLPELNQEELESLLVFLYSGSLPIDKLDKNIYSLSVAADKYEIPFLQKISENRMLESFDSSNALDVLEISDVCSNTKLKDAAMDFIIKHTEEIVFSSRYDAFVHKNPHLCVQITRALLMDMKKKTPEILERERERERVDVWTLLFQTKIAFSILEFFTCKGSVYDSMKRLYQYRFTACICLICSPYEEPHLSAFDSIYLRSLSNGCEIIKLAPILFKG